MGREVHRTLTCDALGCARQVTIGTAGSLQDRSWIVLEASLYDIVTDKSDEERGKRYVCPDCVLKLYKQFFKGRPQ